MLRKIVGLHQDEHGEWVAELDCRHTLFVMRASASCGCRHSSLDPFGRLRSRVSSTKKLTKVYALRVAASPATAAGVRNSAFPQLWSCGLTLLLNSGVPQFRTATAVCQGSCGSMQSGPQEAFLARFSSSNAP